MKPLIFTLRLTFILFIFIPQLLICQTDVTSETNEQRLTSSYVNIPASDRWREDLQALYRFMKEEHQDIYHKTSAGQFEKYYTELYDAIPHLSDSEIVVRFAQFVAMIKDGHTRLTLPLQEGLGLSQAHSKTAMPSDTNLIFRHLPVEFYLFDDGLFITKSTVNFRHLIGKKVIAINEVPIEEAIERTRRFSHYDNELGFKLIGPSRLAIYELLSAMGLTNLNGEVAFTLEEEGGERVIYLKPLNRLSREKFVDDGEQLPERNKMISRQNQDRYYRFHHLEEFNTLYLQLNQMNNALEGPGLIDFMGEVDDYINENSIDRMVVDLRNNFGGNNAYVLSIMNLLSKNAHLNRMGKVYVLIGRKTFSAAQHLVNDLSKWSHALFVGEPTGSSPHSFGDSVKKRLPHSNLTARIASIFWMNGPSSSRDIPWVAPDIPVANLATDYFANRDAALEYCLRIEWSPQMVDNYQRLYQMGGIESAKRWYMKWISDWETSKADLQQIEDLLVGWMKGL